MANHAELARRYGDIAGSELYPSGDLQRRFHVCRQVAVVREHAGLRIGGDHNDAPAGEVAQRGVVILNFVHPIVAKGDGGQALAFRRGINLAGNTRIIEVANQHAVAATLR